jgi:hypothetical protein
MAIADDALFGYESLEDVRAQEIPSGKDELILRFKDSALERPILRRCTKTGGVTNDPMPKSSFTAILKSTLTNAGYLYGPSIHAIRRQLGKEVDSKLVPLVGTSCPGDRASLATLADLLAVFTPKPAAARFDTLPVLAKIFPARAKMTFLSVRQSGEANHLHQDEG